MKTYRCKRALLAILLVLSMLAAAFSAAGIPAFANAQPSISYSASEADGAFDIKLCCHHFDDIANFSMQITYDPAVLRYISYEADAMLSNALVSVNANNGTLTLAFISANDLHFNYCELITLRFDLLNPEPTYTEIHSKILESTDSLLNPQTVSCGEYSGFWVKNDATSNYEPTLSADSDVPLYADASACLGFWKNGGFYAGSFTVNYDPSQLEFVGCAFVKADTGMTLSFTDAGDETTGKINIAFAGTELYSGTGEFLDVIFVSKTSGWCWYDVSDLTLTSGNLQDVNFNYGFGSGFHATDVTADNYFSISNPATVTKGNTFDVVIDLNNNAGFAALTGSLLYDSSLFEFVKAEFNGELLGNALASVTGAASGEVRFAVASTSPITDSGQLLTITLRAISERNETSNLVLDIIELVDLVGIPQSFTTDIGSIKTNQSQSHIHEWVATSVVAPTCTEQGYTVYTCATCGDSNWDNYVDSLGHSYENVVTAPTCTEQGYTTHTCAACGDNFVDSYVPTINHSYTDGVCVYCGAEEVTALLGDVNGDGKINTTDAKLIMQYVLGLIDETKLNLAAADVNGDGKRNTTDAKLIMQLVLGIISEFVPKG